MERRSGSVPKASAATTVLPVLKAAQILKAFSSSEPELGVNEIARRLGLHKSGVSRILATLQQEGLVERVASTSKFRLGLEILMLASRTYAHLDLRQAAAEMVPALARGCKETVTFSILQQDAVVDLLTELSPFSVRAFSWVGRRLPLHSTASGKIILANAPAAQIDRVLAGPLERNTEQTITDPVVLRSELERTRDRGYAISQGEFEQGLSAVAVPVAGAPGGIACSLAVAGPTARLPIERLEAIVPMLQEAAGRISLRLEYSR